MLLCGHDAARPTTSAGNYSAWPGRGRAAPGGELSRCSRTTDVCNDAGMVKRRVHKLFHKRSLHAPPPTGWLTPPFVGPQRAPWKQKSLVARCDASAPAVHKQSHARYHMTATTQQPHTHTHTTAPVSPHRVRHIPQTAGPARVTVYGLLCVSRP